MNGLILTAEESQLTINAHRRCKDKRVADRIKAIYSLGNGQSAEDVMYILMVNEGTLRNYVKRYKEGCIDELRKDHYKGSEARLSEAKREELSHHLEKNTCFRVEGIVAYVKEKYDVAYTVSGMTDLLHYLDFTYKKSKLISVKADKKKQEEFLEQLKKLQESKGEKDPILYMNGVHPRHNTMLAYGWIRKGKDNIIKSNTRRQRININGALDAETHGVIFREDERINATSIIDLLKKVEVAYPVGESIYVVYDNAKYYHSKLVAEFLETSNAKLVFLPPYSPNLNLIQRLWKFMKNKILYNQYYKKFKEATIGFFENIEKYESELSTLLTNNFRVLDVVQS